MKVTVTVIGNTCGPISSSVDVDVDIYLYVGSSPDTITEEEVTELVEQQHPDILNKAETKLNDALSEARSNLPKGIDSDLYEIANYFAEDAEIESVNW